MGGGRERAQGTWSNLHVMTSCGSGEREGSGDLVKPTRDDLMWVGGERGLRGPGQTYT